MKQSKELQEKIGKIHDKSFQKEITVIVALLICFMPFAVITTKYDIAKEWQTWLSEFLKQILCLGVTYMFLFWIPKRFQILQFFLSYILAYFIGNLVHFQFKLNETITILGLKLSQWIVLVVVVVLQIYCVVYTVIFGIDKKFKNTKVRRALLCIHTIFSVLSLFIVLFVVMNQYGWI